MTINMIPDGVVLFISAGITEVGADGCAWLEWMSYFAVASMVQLPSAEISSMTTSLFGNMTSPE